MGETDYNTLLYEKMKAEQDKYRDWLLTQEPAEILSTPITMESGTQCIAGSSLQQTVYRRASR